MSNKFVIQGNLPNLNNYIQIERGNRYAAAKEKKDIQDFIMFSMRICKLKKVCKFPIILKIKWYEKDNRRDVDNIIFAKKFILDAMVKSGIIPDDGRKFVKGFKEDVITDKKNPRIEIEIMEVEND